MNSKESQEEIKGETGEEIIDWMDNYEDTRPWWKKRWSRVYSFFNYRVTPITRARWFFQRIFRGYDDPSWYSFYSWMAEQSIPRLKELKRSSHGIPGSLCPYVEHETEDEHNKRMDNAVKKWDDILSDMIYYMEYCADESSHCGGVDWNIIFEKNIKDGERQYTSDPDPNRLRRGKKYFFRYFESLWD